MKTDPDTPAPLGLVFAGLLLLLALSAASSFLPPAPWKTPAALAIAAAKIALIALFFMRLRYHGGITRVVAAAGLFWLAIFTTLILTDYLTRGRL